MLLFQYKSSCHSLMVTETLAIRHFEQRYTELFHINFPEKVTFNYHRFIFCDYLRHAALYHK